VAAATTQPGERGWMVIGNELGQQNYRRTPGKEETFTGTLEALPPPGGDASTLTRYHGYRLGDRLIAGRGVAGLDALVGKKVEIRGKRVDINLEGVELHEIAVGSVRPTEEKSEK
jgi:hypothetical protein